jgi:predicted dinucleotide-binding enzyme
VRIAILGAGGVGSALGRLWHAAGHDVTFAAQHAAGPQALARWVRAFNSLPASTMADDNHHKPRSQA